MSNTSLTTKVSQSRGWTLILGIAAAVLAAILLVAYLVQYRSSVNDSTAPTPVLVAKNLIPKGTSGTVIAEKQLFQAATLSKDDLKVGAISDPAYLNGRVAVADIFPGQQITTADLSCRPHGRDSHAALREAARRRHSRQRPARPRRLRRERRPRRCLLRNRLGRGHDPRPARTERARDARARRRRSARRCSGRTRALAQTLALASDSGRIWFLLRPAGDAKNAPKKAITSAALLAADQGKQ